MNASALKELVEKYELIFNNDTNFFTSSSNSEISIIDLAFTSLDLGHLQE